MACVEQRGEGQRCADEQCVVEQYAGMMRQEEAALSGKGPPSHHSPSHGARLQRSPTHKCTPPPPPHTQIRTIDRKQEVPHDGSMCDLVRASHAGGSCVPV